MAGSIKAMVYTSDQGDKYIVNIDESNGELTGFDDYINQADAAPIPKGLKMRYANVVEPITGAKRQIYVGKTSSDIWTGAIVGLLLFLVGIESPGNVAFTLQSLVGEKFTRYRAADTGLTDGDVT